VDLARRAMAGAGEWAALQLRSRDWFVQLHGTFRANGGRLPAIAPYVPCTLWAATVQLHRTLRALGGSRPRNCTGRSVQLGAGCL